MMITLRTPGAVASTLPEETDTVMGPYLKILSDGLVEIGGPVPELGQGVHTSLPMILAEELDVDWDQVRVVQAPIYMRTNADGRVELMHGRQHAGGSHSVRRQWPNLRTMGATARAQLIKAAERRWGIDAAELTTQGGAVWHEASGHRLGYGELASAAAEIPLSDDVVLKSSDQFRLVGRDHPPPHMVEVVTGKPIFGIDATLPGMLHATIERCPYLDGEIPSLDDSAALAVPRGRGGEHSQSNGHGDHTTKNRRRVSIDSARNCWRVRVRSFATKGIATPRSPLPRIQSKPPIRYPLCPTPSSSPATARFNSTPTSAC
jgi:isoquinoline 1-oxidoreductase beta subunit